MYYELINVFFIDHIKIYSISALDAEKFSAVTFSVNILIFSHYKYISFTLFGNK